MSKAACWSRAPENASLRRGFTASKCTSCKKQKSRRAACAHKQRLSFAACIITIDSCFGRKFWAASVMTSALKQGHFAMLLPAGSFSAQFIYLHPFYYYIKNLISALSILSLSAHGERKREREDRAFFCLRSSIKLCSRHTQ
jgi:hypothetical protein